MLEYIEVVWKSKTNGNVDSMVFINLSFPNQSEKERERERERERGKGGVVIKKEASSYSAQVLYLKSILLHSSFGLQHKDISYSAAEKTYS